LLCELDPYTILKVQTRTQKPRMCDNHVVKWIVDPYTILKAQIKIQLGYQDLNQVTK
jgi:hypothetical protein